VLLGTVARHQIFEVFAGAGLTVMPSIYNDNSPVAVHESLAAGTPVLAARSGGIPELVDEGCTGYLYDANDPAELAAKAIAHFQRPAHERRAMRRMAVEHATREFGIEKHVSQIEAIYRNAIRDHQSPTHHGTRVGAIRGRI
jgi:glycosyltransferase involved in cell wall biosynthesis